jgi:hypothetical protein
MTRTLLAEMVISLKDNLSADAKKAADSLKSVGTAAADLNKVGGNKGALDSLSSGLKNASRAAAELAAAGVRLKDWGRGFDRSLLSLKASPGQIQEIKAGFDSLARGVKNLDRVTQANALSNYLQGAKAELLGIRAAANEASTALGKMERVGRGGGGGAGPGASGAGPAPPGGSARRGIATAGGYATAAARLGAARVGAAGGAYLGYRGAKAAAGEGSNVAREKLRQDNAGITAEDEARLSVSSGDLSVKYPSMLPRQISEMGRLILPIAGEMGKTMELLPKYTQASVALKTATGSEHDDKSMQDFIRFSNIIGRGTNVEDLTKLLDGFVRTLQADPKAITSGDMVTAAQNSGPAGKAFTTDFWSTVMPAAIVQEKGHRAGTDLASAFQNFMVGRATKESLEAQTQFEDATGESGLREGVVRNKNGKITQKGTLKDGALYAGNPYEWAKKNLVPGLVREGLLPQGYAKGDYSENLNDEQRAGLSTKLPQMLSNRRASNVMELFLGDMKGMEAFMERQRATKGAGSADTDQAKDPHVALEGLGNSILNFGSVVAAPNVAAAAPVLDEFARSISKAANDIGHGNFEDHPVLKVMRDVGKFLNETNTKDKVIDFSAERYGRGHAPMPETYAERAAKMDTDALDEATKKAFATGNTMKQSLDVVGRPTVDTSEMESAVPKAQSIMDRIKAIFSSPVRPNVQMPGTGGATPSAAGRASGGHVGAGRFYQVGEHGPELFASGESGRILPGSAASRRRGSGASAFSPTINLGGVHVHGTSDAESIIEKVHAGLESKLSELVRSMYSDYGMEEAG